MNDLNEILKEWVTVDDEYSKITLKKRELEANLLELMTKNGWRDYNHDKIKVSITEVIVTDIIEDELPLLLSNSDIEKVTRRTREERLIIITDEKRKKLNKLLRGK